jgi:hypothetical protein
MSPAGPKRLRRRQARRAAAEAAAEAAEAAAEAAADAAGAAEGARDSPERDRDDGPVLVTLSQAEEGACPVCQGEWRAGAEARVLQCAHRFHPACVGAWLDQYKAQCPVCRAHVAERAAPRPARALGLFLEPCAHGHAPGGGGRGLRAALR